MGASVKMNKTLALFLIFSVIGISYAYAETVEIEIPHTIGEQNCQTFRDEQGIPFTQCVFDGIFDNPNHLSTETDDGCEEGYDRDYITKECKTPELIEAEAKQSYEEFRERQLEKLTPEEKAVIELEAEEELDAADKQLLEKLKKLNAVCRYDVAQIQTYEEFDIPVDTIYDPDTGTYSLQLYKNWDLVNIDLAKHYLLKKIDMAVEACLGQATLRNEILGAGTTNKIVDGFGSQRYHAEHTYAGNEFAGTDFNKVKANLYMKDDGIYRTYQPSIRDTICNNDHFTQAFKNQHACPKPVYVDTIPQPQSFNPFGDEGSELLDQFSTYKDGDMKEQEQIVRQKAIDRDLADLERLK